MFLKGYNQPPAPKRNDNETRRISKNVVAGTESIFYSFQPRRKKKFFFL